MPHAAPSFRPFASEPAADQRRGSARARGYGAAWDKASLAHRAANPLCLGCAAVGRTVACHVVDHVIPHKGNMALFWDKGNWQVACTWHHDQVKQQLELAYVRGEITADGLRLDSTAAKALTMALDPG